MEKTKVTPMDFFLWVGAMITLYASLFAFISLMFEYLNYLMPDPLNYYYSDPYSSGISYEMASLIVLFPTFLILMRLIRRSIQSDSSRGEVWVRRWVVFLTLFVAGATIVGDLITLLMYFFSGDVTPRFLLKVLVILVVAGGAFSHFLADLRGYWDRNPSKARFMTWAVGFLALASVIAGFFIVGTPWEARLYRYDNQKVENLQMIQSQVAYYWQAKEKLPTDLSDLNDPLSGFRVPTDPQTGTAYEYSVKPPLSFEICATFNAESRPYSTGVRGYPFEPGYPASVAPGTNGTWEHGGGRTCFARTIDPAFYPPLKR